MLSNSAKILSFMVWKFRTAAPRTFRVNPLGLAHLFTLSCGVPVVFGPTRNEFGDDVTIEFIRHIPEKTTCGDGRLIGTPFVDHAVRVIVKDLLLEDIKGLIEFEPSVTGGEGRHKYIGFGAFDRIVIHTGVDGLQDVVAAQTESADVEGGIRQ